MITKYYFQTFSVKIYRLSGKLWKIKEKLHCLLPHIFWKININANGQVSNIKAIKTFFKYALNDAIHFKVFIEENLLKSSLMESKNLWGGKKHFFLLFLSVFLTAVNKNLVTTYLELFLNDLNQRICILHTWITL